MKLLMFIRVGDQIINTSNVVSFDIDVSDIVRIWYVGCSTPLTLNPPIPAQAILELLRINEWLVPVDGIGRARYPVDVEGSHGRMRLNGWRVLLGSLLLLSFACAVRRLGDPIRPGFNLLSKDQDIQLGPRGSRPNPERR